MVGWLVSLAKGLYLIGWNGEDDYLSSDKILIILIAKKRMMK